MSTSTNEKTNGKTINWGGHSFTVFKIPKGKGKFRKIYAPSKEAKRAIKRALRNIEISSYGYSTGFFKGTSPVYNAAFHIGYDISIKFDFSNFFDSISYTDAEKIIPGVKIFMFPDGICAQGLPSSPIIANLCAEPFDNDVVQQLKDVFDVGVYTRYADDINISINGDKSDIETVKEIIFETIKKYPFQINERKTRVMYAKGGYRKITGVSVGKDHIRGTREIRRKLRAAKHQGNELAARGLESWYSTNLGSKFKFNLQLASTIEAATKLNYSTWDIPKYGLPFKDRDDGKIILISPNGKYSGDFEVIMNMIGL